MLADIFSGRCQQFFHRRKCGELIPQRIILLPLAFDVLFKLGVSRNLLSGCRSSTDKLKAGGQLIEPFQFQQFPNKRNQRLFIGRILRLINLEQTAQRHLRQQTSLCEELSIRCRKLKLGRRNASVIFDDVLLRDFSLVSATPDGRGTFVSRSVSQTTWVVVGE